jgi:hypothetical protein
MCPFAEQAIQQAKLAFDELMAATYRVVSAFEGQTSSTQTNAREIQRKVIAYSERNVAASLEFAQKLLSAKDAEAVLESHPEYVKGRMLALSEQAHDNRPACGLYGHGRATPGLEQRNCA